MGADLIASAVLRLLVVVVVVTVVAMVSGWQQKKMPREERTREREMVKRKWNVKCS